MTGLKSFVERQFKSFGINKKREITRLLFEISKREAIPYRGILKNPPENLGYRFTKEALLKRRFPQAFSQNSHIAPHLPKLEIRPENRVKVNAAGFKFKPKNVYIEGAVSNSWMAARFKSLFPGATFIRIGSLKAYIKKRRPFGIGDYNRRRDSVFIVKEKSDFFKKCPCTKSAVSCGYHIFNLGFGCPYECVYCYLQEYTNYPGIILPANIESFFSQFSKYSKKRMRIGTGEFTDSLALDDITQYSTALVDFFSKNPGITFEFKTKSANISNLLNLKHRGNIAISWSLNPPNIIKENEFYTASLTERLSSAAACVKAGYRIGFHFDPMVYCKGWEAGYEGLVNRLFDNIPAKHIVWISIGSLRFNPRLKVVIENRFPENKILDEELLLGFDNKLRYTDRIRFTMYRNMLYWIKKRSKGVKVYLCMEKSGISEVSGRAK